jgi:hypothetical protein
MLKAALDWIVQPFFGISMAMPPGQRRQKQPRGVLNVIVRKLTRASVAAPLDSDGGGARPSFAKIAAADVFQRNGFSSTLCSVR